MAKAYKCDCCGLYFDGTFSSDLGFKVRIRPTDKSCEFKQGTYIRSVQLKYTLCKDCTHDLVEGVIKIPPVMRGSQRKEV